MSKFAGAGEFFTAPWRCPSHSESVPRSPAEAVRLAEELREQGNDHFKCGKSATALKHYEEALYTCERYRLKDLAVKLHGNIAAVYLREQQYETAYAHAEECIQLDRGFPKGYYRRADAGRLLGVSFQKAGRTNPRYFQNAAQDYLQCFKLCRDLESLCQAVMLAVDHNFIGTLKLFELNLRPADCTKLIDRLLSREDSKAAHLKFLLVKTPDLKGSGIAGSLQCNLSEISCSELLEKPDLESATLRAFFELGGLLTCEDVEISVRELPIDKVDVLRVVIDACSSRKLQIGLDSLCRKSLLDHRDKFAAFFISRGAKPDRSLVMRVMDWDDLNEGLFTYVRDGYSDVERAALLCAAVKKNSTEVAAKVLSSSSIAAEHVDLGGLIQSTSGALAASPGLVQQLIAAGVSPNGSERSIRPLEALLRLKCYSVERKAAVALLVSLLCRSGADLEDLMVPGEDGATLVHRATELAMDTGNTEMLETVCRSFKNFPDNGKLTDNKGLTPFHIAMRGKRSETSERICTILGQYPINPLLANCSGQRPDHGKSKTDRRVQILQEAAAKFLPPSNSKLASAKEVKKSEREQQPRGKRRKAGRRARRRGREDGGDGTEAMTGDVMELDCGKALEVPSEDPLHETAAAVTSAVSESLLLTSVNECLKTVLARDNDYFTSPGGVANVSSDSRHHLSGSPLNKEISAPRPVFKAAERESTHAVAVNKSEASACFEMCKLGEEGSNVDGSLYSDLFILPCFDDLPWEVECPEKVVKFFKDKTNPAWLCELAVRRIEMLASGEWRERNCKKIASKPRLQLYETRLTRSASFVWEVVVQFSPRCTNKVISEGLSSTISAAPRVIHVYSEVIRIWDVVSDRDQLSHCIRHIEKSHDRGREAAIKIPLVSEASAQSRSSGERLPKMFLLGSDLPDESKSTKSVAKQLQFVPAGSTKEDEYYVVTFYSFSTALVKSMLEGKDARRDFPFKEWPREHDIINMPYDKESILLLGRSGTGKTTCCLYRLWNQFQSYWNVAISSGPLMSRKPLVLCRESKSSEFSGSDFCLDLEGDGASSFPVKDIAGVSDGSCAEIGDPACHRQGKVSVAHIGQPRASLEESASLSVACCSSGPKGLEHLHQVFVSKNYVLCAQMKKRFYDMAVANRDVEPHMAYEDDDLPDDLSQVEDLAFPLFLTTRQFLLLLDNSLHDGRNFFPRAEDGSLKVKILSSDYDHEDPDTLLDLEDSESDGERDYADFDDRKSHQSGLKLQLQEWREVTASYFVEQVWPKISHVCADKAVDPLLVWMEIKSFIKGSRLAVETERGYLSEEQYEELGRKMAANFAGNRSEIYALFLQYQKVLHRRRGLNVFDECDFICSIHARLSDLHDLPWSIHQFYVDEVQDFTQAELSLLLRVCRDPNGLFLTGDTAQSIMRGISFRFGDLRSLFYDVQQKVKRAQVASTALAPVRVAVPHLHRLTINFRSHSGILQLAASIIDLLKQFFPSSFDCLPGDEGMFSGPTPALLHSCDVSDLALLLRSNKRESSSIEFGAHQVIIVQSEAAKKALPDVLKAGIILTVFEAKGLEFDDVLLYNFFTDSNVSKEWRVVTSFLEESPTLIENPSPAFESQPRPLAFSEKQHKSLNSELKYLYTAVTRAKCHLWIYDSDEDKRLSVFDYWHKRGLVKVIRIDETSEEDESALFAATSTGQEWKEQGDYFRKKRLWEPAMKCYQKAGNPHLEMEARAYSLAQLARGGGGHRTGVGSMQELYMKAAQAFLECDRLCHDVKYLSNAAKCLRNGRRHADAARLFERLGQYEHAFRGFMKSKDLDGCANLKERAGDYSGAVKLLVAHNKRIDALVRAHAYENQGLVLMPDVSVAQLAHTFAKVYAKQKNMTQLVKVLEYVADISQRIRFLKEAHLYDKVCEVYIQENQLTEAYRVLSAQAKFTRGIKLAQEQGDEKMVAKFVFQKVIADLTRNTSAVGDSEVVERLTELSGSEDAGLKAKACLLLGKLTGDVALYRKALGAYKSARNVVGEIEGFCALVEHAQEKDNRISLIMMAVEACKSVQAVIEAMERCKKSRLTATGASILNQVEDFYGLQKQGKVYCTPRGQDLWIGRLEACAVLDGEPDSDGMLRLDVLAVQKEVKTHVEKYVVDWLEKRLKVKQTLKSKLSCFPFHKELQEGQGHLKQSFRAYPSGELKDYLRYCLLSLEVNQIQGKYFPVAIIKNVLLNLFQPGAAVHLPVCRLHINLIRESSLACKLLEGVAADVIGDRDFKLDGWLQTWRIHCVLGRGVQRLESVLVEQARLVNIRAGKINSGSKQGTQECKQEQNGSQSSEVTTRVNDPTDTGCSQKESTDARADNEPKSHVSSAECNSTQFVLAKDEQKQDVRSQDDTKLCTKTYKPPFSFVYNTPEGKYDHVFSRWLKSCVLIAREARVVLSSKIVLRHFCHIIADRSNLRRTISIANLVNILTVHSVALLAIVLQCTLNLKRSRPSAIIVPNTYPHAVQNFDDLNCQDSDDKCLLQACVEEVKRGERSDSLSKLRKDALELLGLILDLLIGKYKRYCTVLRSSVTQRSCLQNAEADRCLVLALTLFGNLACAGFFSGTQAIEYQEGICESLSPLARLPEPQHLKQAQNLFASVGDVAGTFLTVGHILSVADRSGHLVQLKFRDNSGRVKPEFAPVLPRNLPQVPIQHVLPVPPPPQSPARSAPQVPQSMLSRMPFEGLPPVLSHSLRQAGVMTDTISENRSQIFPQVPISVPLLQPLPEPFNWMASATANCMHMPMSGFPLGSHKVPVATSLSTSTPPLDSATTTLVYQTPSFPGHGAALNLFPEPQNPMSQTGSTMSTTVAVPPGFGMSPHPQSQIQTMQDSLKNTNLYPNQHVYASLEHMNPPYHPSFTGFRPGKVGDISSQGIQNLSPFDPGVYMHPQSTNHFRCTGNAQGSACHDLSWPNLGGKSPDTSQHGNELLDSSPQQVAAGLGVEDEEIQQALASQSDSFLSIPSLSKNHDVNTSIDLPDMSMVDETFCRICAVALRSSTGKNAIVNGCLKEELYAPEKDESEVNRVAATVNEETETYHTHVESENHKRNAELYEAFSLSVEWEYVPYREELSSMVQEYSTADDVPFALDVAINDAKVEIEKNDQRIEEVKRSCAWREGLFEIRNEMTDRMKFLTKALNEKQQASSRQQTVVNVTATSTSEGYRMDGEDEELEIEQSAATVVEGEKLEKRRKKRQRRRKMKK